MGMVLSSHGGLGRLRFNTTPPAGTYLVTRLGAARDSRPSGSLKTGSPFSSIRHDGRGLLSVFLGLENSSSRRNSPMSMRITKGIPTSNASLPVV
jgi:hypothetical protein